MWGSMVPRRRARRTASRITERQRDGSTPRPHTALTIASSSDSCGGQGIEAGSVHLIAGGAVNAYVAQSVGLHGHRPATTDMCAR